MILVIDNYDSFTYNLVQLIAGVEPDIQVVRNDAKTVGEIERMRPSHVVISPGPGRPRDAGICEELVGRLAGKVPILGVCLGHQAICERFGAEIDHAKRLMHGKKSRVFLDVGCPIFSSLPGVIEAGRYHSLAARRDTIPPELRVVAEDPEGEVMAVAHAEYPVYGLQFHPESVLTPDGETIIRNFLRTGGLKA